MRTERNNEYLIKIVYKDTQTDEKYASSKEKLNEILNQLGEDESVWDFKIFKFMVEKKMSKTRKDLIRKSVEKALNEHKIESIKDFVKVRDTFLSIRFTSDEWYEIATQVLCEYAKAHGYGHYIEYSPLIDWGGNPRIDRIVNYTIRRTGDDYPICDCRSYSEAVSVCKELNEESEG